MMDVRLTMTWLSIMAGSAASALPYDHWLAQRAYAHYTETGRYLFESRQMTEAMRVELTAKQEFWGHYTIATDLTVDLPTRLRSLAWLHGREP